MSGYFITFEGGEGVGKTTQIKALAANLEKQGRDVVVTREPGGTPAAETIRSLLVHEDFGGQWSPEAEAMLIFAARAMHVRDVITPALEQGKVVISDRYIDSTRAYQGYLQGMDMAFIKRLERDVVCDVLPNLTIILDLPVEVGMARVSARGVEGGAGDHYDRADQSVHQTLRDAFLDIHSSEPDRCVIVDADKESDQIAQDVLSIVSEKIGEAT